MSGDLSGMRRTWLLIKAICRIALQTSASIKHRVYDYEKILAIQQPILPLEEGKWEVGYIGEDRRTASGRLYWV